MSFSRAGALVVAAAMIALATPWAVLAQAPGPAPERIPSSRTKANSVPHVEIDSRGGGLVVVALGAIYAMRRYGMMPTALRPPVARRRSRAANPAFRAARFLFVVQFEGRRVLIGQTDRGLTLIKSVAADPAAAGRGRMRTWAFLLVPVALLLGLDAIAAAAPSTALSLPGVELKVAPGGQREEVALAIKIIVALTVLSLAPALLVCVTSFVRIIIVLSMLRHAIGMQEPPPHTVLISLALFLPRFTMAPVIEKVNSEGVQPYLNGKTADRIRPFPGMKPLPRLHDPADPRAGPRPHGGAVAHREMSAATRRRSEQRASSSPRSCWTARLRAAFQIRPSDVCHRSC